MFWGCCCWGEGMWCGVGKERRRGELHEPALQAAPPEGPGLLLPCNYIIIGSWSGQQRMYGWVLQSNMLCFNLEAN